MSAQTTADTGTAGCSCIEKVDAKLADRGDNTKILVPWFGPQRPFVETTKLDASKRGKPSKLFASFCPFCGVKYPEGDSNLAAAKGAGR